MTKSISKLELSIEGKMLLYESALADNPECFDSETWKQYRRTKAEYNYLHDRAMKEKYQRERTRFDFKNRGKLSLSEASKTKGLLRYRQLQGGVE